jgi:hypothetical protein
MGPLPLRFGGGEICLHLIISFCLFSYTPWMSAIIPSRFMSRVKFRGDVFFGAASRGGDLRIFSFVPFPGLSAFIIAFMKSEASCGFARLTSCCCSTRGSPCAGGEGDFLNLAEPFNRGLLV